jgi:hypothetical protein
LLQVKNPTDDRPRGIQSDMPVCEFHSFRWSGLWGAWIIENDKTYGVVYGGTGPVSKMERQRELGEISEGEFAAWFVGFNMPAESGGVTLAKVRKVMPRPLRRKPTPPVEVVPEDSETQLIYVSNVEVNMDIRFQYGTRGVEGTVDEIHIDDGHFAEIFLIEHVGGMVNRYEVPRDAVIMQLF